jgi:hypothetical protein
MQQHQKICTLRLDVCHRCARFDPVHRDGIGYNDTRAK